MLVGMRLVLSACGVALLAVSFLLVCLGLQSGFSVSGGVSIVSFALAAVAALAPKLRKVFYVALMLLLLNSTFRSCEGKRSVAELRIRTANRATSS